MNDFLAIKRQDYEDAECSKYRRVNGEEIDGYHLQYNRQPDPCQRTTVSGWTMVRCCRLFGRKQDNPLQRPDQPELRLDELAVAPCISLLPGVNYKSLRRGDMNVAGQPAVNTITSHILTEAGYIVISVKNGQEGIEALKKYPEISLAVLDVVMPVLDGRAVYDFIQKSGCIIPVLFCSGLSFSVLKENEFKDIDVPVLAKPFSAEDLLVAVSRLKKVKLPE